jgi:predicted nuclease of restriction endonuclease-like (RecB) superfamily
MCFKGKTCYYRNLADAIAGIDDKFSGFAKKAVNVSLTLRNWAIGFYIREYEQTGADRAQYGEALLDNLAERIKRSGMKRSSARELRRYRQLYLIYPNIWQSVSVELQNFLPETVPQRLAQIRESATPQSSLSVKNVITGLSFTHLAELITIEDDTKRTFYEVECISGNWSVRELKRQIASLYYERSGLSTDKSALSKLANMNTEQQSTRLTVHDPYVFEFLGLKPKEVMSESHLENELISGIEEFLLELGHGFCFEARQKRIIIGDEHYFIDLVFYHRILKCHILVELKTQRFTQENIGQLNTYVSWYRKNMTTTGDNPPIGILLCTEKDHALVEYALAGMDNDLFVSKYLLELPKKEDMLAYIEQRILSEKHNPE